MALVAAGLAHPAFLLLRVTISAPSRPDVVVLIACGARNGGRGAFTVETTRALGLTAAEREAVLA